jgi:endogenous inhibitor of DNA gyrase (YacG/DUF329 family)
MFDISPATNDRIDRMGEAPVCAQCRRHPVDDRWRPFCSERCRNEDLARWADGRYRVPADPASSSETETDEPVD